MRVWLSDDNAIVREKLRRLAASRQRPLLERIVRQGIAEGTFTSREPGFLPSVLVGLLQAMGELAMELAGMGEARLYAGSYSEWITDPERHVIKS